jgi:hypothetical protein
MRAVGNYPFMKTRRPERFPKINLIVDCVGRERRLYPVERMSSEPSDFFVVKASLFINDFRCYFNDFTLILNELSFSVTIGMSGFIGSA